MQSGAALVLAMFAYVALSAAKPDPANAQSYAVDRGSFMLGGTASFSSFKFSSGSTSGDRTTEFTLAPSLQYFVIPGLALGAQGTIARQSRDQSSSRALGIGPIATYYFGRGERSWHPFITASAGITRSDFESENTFTAEETATRYQFGAGLLFLLSSAVGVNTEFYYMSRNAESEAVDPSGAPLGRTDITQTRFGLAVGISAFVF